MVKSAIFTATNTQPSRLDKTIRTRYPQWGRSAVNRIIENKQVKVNGKTVWLASWKVNKGDKIHITNPPEDKIEPPKQFYDSWLIANTDDIIAINKPAGLLSMATKHRKKEDLLYLVQQQFGDVSLFHRLDRDTLGIVLFTRTSEINQQLDRAFKKRTVEKNYYALVAYPNDLQSQGKINLPLVTDSHRRDKMMIAMRHGKSAMTRYKIIETQADRQLVHLQPITGRTHQLRVHLQAMNAPILGDRLYSNNHANFDRLYLHAQSIKLPNDINTSQHEFVTPVPW